jgi:hypothetical protein
MEAAVEDDCSDGCCRVTGQNPFIEGFMNTFFDCRYVVSRDTAADDFIDKFIVAADRKRFKPEEYMTVLAVAAGLFLVLVFSLYRRGNCLTVGDFRSFEDDADAEFSMDIFRSNVELGFTKSRENRFACFRIPPYLESRVLLNQSGEC